MREGVLQRPTMSPDAAVASAEANDLPEVSLNPPQQQAVAHVNGPLIVFAGAGSGKTRVITYRIANLVAQHHVPPYRILAVTFTNKAAAEMKARLSRLLGEELTRTLWIGTFHAVCVRLIRRYSEAIGVPSNFTIYDDADQKAVMRRVLKDEKLDERRWPPKRIIARIQREKQEARNPQDFELNEYGAEVIQRCYEAYQRRLRAANAVDFADLLLLVLRLVENPENEAAQHLRNRFSHVLVDEFQDVNLVQYRMVRALAQTRNICVVGDDDQSIYRWRGADVRNIRGFTTDFKDATLVKLEQNYRSCQHVVNAALGVIRFAKDRQPKELWTANPEGDPVFVVHAANERDEAGYVVLNIKRAIAAGASPREIAVFYRVHAQSRVLEEAMRAERIPYQIIGGQRFYDRAEVKDVLAYLRVLVNPDSDVDMLRIINKPARKIGNKTIERLIDMARQQRSSLWYAIEPLCETDIIGKAARRSLLAFTEMLTPLIDAVPTAPPAELARDLVKDSGYGAWLRKQDSAEADARIDNVDELLGSIADYEQERLYADEETSLADFLTSVTLLSAQDTMNETARVPMMTIHAAKGLEFDEVFITGMEERLFPLRGQQPGEEEELEEERRLAYVAITRARKRLHMLHTNTRTIYGQLRYNQPSRFIDDVPSVDQQRVATETLHSLSNQYGGGQQVPHRDMVRAEPRTALRRRPAKSPVQRDVGERFIERDEHDSCDFSDDFDGFDSDVGDEGIRIGMRVRHVKFGVGAVREVRAGSDPLIRVAFSGVGLKLIKLSYLAPA